jgi:cation diffusion facilitator CzcD-associated flavoprotein CzcO
MTVVEPFDVLIVGAGISGIGMATHLARKCPSKRYVVLDRRERIGGTWDLFRFPGVRSDSDMSTLGFADEPWRDERMIGKGAAIRGYLEDVAERRGVRENIRFGQKVTAGNWDSVTGLWTLTLEGADGAESTVAGRFLYLGSGYYDYDEPYDAPIPGLADFGGTTIHPQFWPEDFDSAGKRVVVIGSGATAVTLVPALAETAEHVTMLQRTPSWYLIMPSKDRLTNLVNRLLPAKWAHRVNRSKNALLQSWLFKRSRTKPAAVGQTLHKQLAGQLGPDFSRADFTPPYGPWEQRMCLVPDGDMFAAMREGKASVVTGHIERVESDGILLTDGRRLEADVIVTATGLKLAFLGKIALSLDGKPIDITRHHYYRNCMFSNVPNLAALFGYLAAGWTLRVDIVADYLCRLLAQMDAWGMDVVTPYLAEDHGLEEDDVFGMFSSGYIERGRHLVPRSAKEKPWRISMDYFADRKELRDAPIDDGLLRFERIDQPALA